jgi:hypothetical protein
MCTAPRDGAVLFWGSGWGARRASCPGRGTRWCDAPRRLVLKSHPRTIAMTLSDVDAIMLRRSVVFVWRH